MSIERALRDIHPDARIISVEVDEHEHRDTVCCEVCLRRIQPHDDRLLDGTILAPVARIMFVAPGYDPEGEPLADSGEWAVLCRRDIREALELWRADVAARPIADATVSARGAQLRAIDDVVDSLARVA